MTYKRIGVGRYVGQSADTKPITLSDNDVTKTLLERDSGREYVLSEESFWNYKQYETNLDFEPGYEKRYRPSFHRETGDSFSESLLERGYTLDGKDTTASGLYPLGIVSKYHVSELYPMRGYKTYFFNGADHGASPITNFDMRNGTLFGGWIRTHRSSAVQVPFSYKMGKTNAAGITIRLNTSHSLEVEINTGANRYTSPQNEVDILDNRWHYVGVLYDPATTSTYLIVATRYELEFFEKIFSNTMPNMSDANGEIVMGAEYDSVSNVYDNGFVGQIANFAFYSYPDANLLQHVLSADRFGMSQNSSIMQYKDQNATMGGYFQLDRKTQGIPAHYHKYHIDLDEGEYDVTLTQHRMPDGGRYNILINGIKYLSTQTQYNATPVYDESVTIKHKKFPGGTNTIEIQIVDKESASAGYKLRFSEIRFKKVSGKNTQCSDSFMLTPYDFERSYNNFVIVPAFKAPFGVASEFVTNDANNFMESDVYAAEGGYHCTISIKNGNDRGIAEILVNGKSCATHDPYGKTGTELVTFFTNLKKGRNIIRVQLAGKNAAATARKLSISHFAGHIKLQAGTGNKILLSPWDADYENIAGSAGRQTGNYRFAAQTRIDHGEKISYRRYFTGGIYEITYAGNAGGGGTGKLSLDDNIIIMSSIAHSTTAEVKKRQFLSIEPGYHNVTVENIHASKSMAISDIGFTAIGTRQEMMPATYEGNDNDMVPIGAVSLLRDKDLIEIDLGDTNYEELYMQIRGKRTNPNSTTSFGITMRINEIANNYKFASRTLDPNINSTRRTTRYKTVELGHQSISDQKYLSFAQDVKMKIVDHGIRKTIAGSAQAVTSTPGAQYPVVFSYDFANIEKIYKIKILKSGSEKFAKGTTVKIFGRRKSA